MLTEGLGFRSDGTKRYSRGLVLVLVLSKVPRFDVGSSLWDQRKK